MNAKKPTLLEAMGGRVTTANEFLNLSPDESAEVEALVPFDKMRAVLAGVIRDAPKVWLTQARLV